MHTETFILKIPVYEFQAAGGLAGFKINFETQVRNPLTKMKESQRYIIVVFAPNPEEAEYYRRNLVEGSTVVVSAKEQIVVQDNQGVNAIQMTFGSIDKIFNPNHVKKQHIRTNYGANKLFDHDERERQRAHAMEAECD